jgi:hypothetical protein
MATNWSTITSRLNTLQTITDGLASVMGQVDAIAQAARSRIRLSPEDLESRCQSGIEYRLSYGIASALVTSWQTLDKADGDATSELDAALHIAEHVEQSVGEARQNRVAWIWLVDTDPEADQSLPIKPIEPGTAVQLHVLSATEVVPGAMCENNPGSQQWDKPTHYQVTPRRRVSYHAPKVHWTRLVRVGGLRRSVIRDNRAGDNNDATSIAPSDLDADLSISDVYGQEIDAYQATQIGTVRALLTKSTLFIRANVGKATAAEQEQLFRTMIRNLAPRLGMFGIGMLSSAYEIHRHDVAVSGVGEAFEVVAAGLTVPEGIPLAKIIPTPPGGLGNDDRSSARMWSEFASDYRGSIINPVILTIYERLLGPGDRKIEWAKPKPATAEEAAAERSAWATELSTLVSAAILTEDQAAQLYAERLGRELPKPAGRDLDPPNQAEIDRVAASVGQPSTAADAETYTPPEGAQGNARKVLRWRDEHGDAVKGMTRTGWTRASQLASGDPVSRETVGRMAAFERHRQNAEVAEEYKDEPWRDAGYVAWLGWGGDSGINWAADIVARDK